MKIAKCYISFFLFMSKKISLSEFGIADRQHVPESTHPFERNPDLEMIEIGPKYMNIRTKFPQNSPTCVNNSVSKCLTSDNNHELVMSRAKWVGNGRREEIRLIKKLLFRSGAEPNIIPNLRVCFQGR